MKQLLKIILPQGAINTARDARDRARLSALPRLAVKAENLKPAAALDLPGLLAHADAEKNWQRDHDAITRTFGGAHVLEGVNPGDRRALYQLISALKPKNILEIGTHVGASTLYIACALKSAGVTGRIVTADIVDVNDPQSGPWRRVGLKQTPQDYAAQLGVAGVISFRQGTALDFMKATPERFDFIFLDGDHAAQAVYREVAAATRILNPGGVILLHDYYPDGRPLFPDGSIISGPYRALERILKENREIAVASLTPLPWPTKQGSQASSLALVLRR